jgi:hypothetical protein
MAGGLRTKNEVRRPEWLLLPVHALILSFRVRRRDVLSFRTPRCEQTVFWSGAARASGNTVN